MPAMCANTSDFPENLYLHLATLWTNLKTLKVEPIHFKATALSTSEKLVEIKGTLWSHCWFQKYQWSNEPELERGCSNALNLPGSVQYSSQRRRKRGQILLSKRLLTKVSISEGNLKHQCSDHPEAALIIIYSGRLAFIPPGSPYSTAGAANT